MFPRRRAALPLFLILLFLGALAATGPVWLTWVGNVLVYSSAPSEADAALVLAGDYTGSRILLAASLVRDGYAPVVYVSGPMKIYGVNEADLAIALAEKGGWPEKLFIPLYLPASSTQEECSAIGRELRLRRAYRILLVTSNFHTARARRTCASEFGEGFEIRVIAAPDLHFSPESWWKTREGRKTVFFEYSKTIAHLVGL